MYNYYQQQQIKPFIKGRPVSSLEEVKAMSIDFDGSVFYFPDLANNKIYTKQVNMDGTCSIIMYEPKPIPEAQIPDYVTKKELEDILQTFKESLKKSNQASITSQF